MKITVSERIPFLMVNSENHSENHTEKLLNPDY